MLKDQRGVTLVEVLASVVIIVLLVTVFMNLFLTSAQSNKVSEDVVDYTFIAQRQMETLYEDGQQNSFTDIESVMTDVHGFTIEQSSPEEMIFRKTETSSDGAAYVLEASFRTYTPNDQAFSGLADTLKRTVIKVRPEQSDKSLAQMESLIEWRDSADEE